MKYFIFLVIFPFILVSCNNDNNVLLDEYKLLYTDIENFRTNGYKSFFSPELNKATLFINDTQGHFTVTDGNLHCGIWGKGFFKV